MRDWVRRVLARGVWLALGIVLLFAGARSEAEETRSPDTTGQAVGAAIRHSALRGKDLSVLVVDRHSGAQIFEKGADRALVPASNQKLLTAAAALHVFGPAHRFETRLVATSPIDGSGGVDGLCLVGAGDPAMTSEDWWRLAADLRRGGLRQVRGPICLDDSVFDRVRWHPSWGPVSARAYHAPISGLSANYGAFAVEVAPGSASGSRARVDLDPPLLHFAVQNVAITGGRRGARLTVRRRANEGREAIRVSGEIALGRDPKVIYRSTGLPTRYAGAVFQAQLQANGIAAGGTTTLGTAPPGAVEVHVHRGKAMSEIVGLLLKYSNNQIAESLVKSLGASRGEGPGSWPSGVSAVRGELERRGLPMDGVQISDGSGLSRENRVSARLLVALLRSIDRDFALAPEILSSLPIAGLDGTLKDRAEAVRGRVRAKTGRLDGVASLSGVAAAHDGREYIFALLTNGEPGNDAAVGAAIDGFLAALVGPAPVSTGDPANGDSANPAASASVAD